MDMLAREFLRIPRLAPAPEVLRGVELREFDSFGGARVTGRPRVGQPGNAENSQ